MALCLAHQDSFLGVGLRHWTHDADAYCRRHGARSEHGQPNPVVYRKHTIRSAVSARTQHFRHSNDGGAFRLRLSFSAHASRPWPHRQRADIFESGESRTWRDGRTLMKGFTPLVLGILATLAFSWLGLAYIPDLQIGNLDPQSDEEGTDIYPMPKSGMAERGRRIYIANGCFYCHSEQVRADYAASDIDRKWGDRRSAPRDYIFDRPALLGKMRLGPDLANIGKRAPAEEEAAPAQPGPSNPAPPNASPPAANASPPPANTAAQQNAKPAAAQPPTSPAPAASPAQTAAASSPAASPPAANASPP